MSIFGLLLLYAGMVPAQGPVKPSEPFVLIRGGTYEMGTSEKEIPKLMEKFGVRRAELFQEETPRHKVTVGDFFLYRAEVTNAMFRQFVLKRPEWQKDKIAPAYQNGKYLQNWNGNNFPEGQSNYPVTFVSWYAAAAFCTSIGMRLPTEAEWEYAARGGLIDKQFPWGDEVPDKTRANYSATGIGAPTKVGSYPANGYGLYDMAGNVWEYLTDEWQKYPGTNADPLSVFKGPAYLSVKTRRALRGGSFGGSPINLRVTYRDSHAPENAVEHVGFRCAMTAKK